MYDNCCMFCKYGYPMVDKDDKKVIYYECRKNPPVVTQDNGFVSYAKFPKVQPDFWCGNYEALEVIEEDNK